MSETLMPVAPSNRILIIGDTPENEDFVAWYLLRLIHGADRVTTVFAATDADLPAGILEGEYEAIFLLNHVFDFWTSYLAHTTVLFVIDNHTAQMEESIPDHKPLWVAQERSHQRVYQEGSKAFSRIITAQESRTGARRSLSSILIDALTFVKLGDWWNSPAPVTDSPYLGLALAGCGEERFNGLMATLRMLDALPAYADRYASRLHDQLEALVMPTDLTDHPPATHAAHFEAGYQRFDEFFRNYIKPL